jgi:membrane protease YdiL (CAAX protease family)
MAFDQENSLPHDPAASGDSVEATRADAGSVDPPQTEAFVPGFEPPVLGPYQEEGGRLREFSRLPIGSRRPLPDDLRVPWGWVDLLFLVIFWIGGTLVATIALAIVFQSRGISWTQLQQFSRPMSAFIIVDQVAISLFLMIYLAIYTRLRFDAPFWRTLGWREFDIVKSRTVTYLEFVVLGLVLSGVVQLASAAFPAKTKLPIENFFQDRESALLLMLMSVLLAPVVEETIFRGYIYPVVARSFGVVASVVATGMLFGLLHAEQLKGGLWQIALMMLVGIIFTWVRAAKRTVLASYLLHLSYNSFLFLAFLVSSDGLRSLPR